VRQAAAKNPKLADGLEERLAGIDAVLATDRRELASSVPTLSWPARNSVIHEPRPPTAAEAEQRAVKKWRQLEAAAQAAEAAAKAAEQGAAVAACDAERAKKSHARLGPMPTVSYLNGLERPRRRVNGKLVTVLISEEEREYRLLEFERWAESQKIASQLWLASLEEQTLAREARERAEDARWEEDAAAAECTSAIHAAEAKAEAAEAAEAQAAEAVARARIAEMESRIAALELEQRTKTHARLDADAARVWGASAAPTSPPPRVILLVGKSPESIHTIGESRVISQQVTSGAERVRMARLAMAVEGVPVGEPMVSGANVSVVEAVQGVLV
jgi:hypothetical protein